MHILESRHPFLSPISSSKKQATPLSTFPTNEEETFHTLFLFLPFSATQTHGMFFSKRCLIRCWPPNYIWKMRNYASYLVLLLLFFSLTFLPRTQSADSTFAPSFYTEEIYKELQNLATLLNKDIQSSLGFCIKDVWVTFYYSLLL